METRAPINRAPVAGERVRHEPSLASSSAWRALGSTMTILKVPLPGLLRCARRLVLAEGQHLENVPSGRVAFDRVDGQSANDYLRHRQGDRAISLTDGDQTRRFVEHDLRQAVVRRTPRSRWAQILHRTGG